MTVTCINMLSLRDQRETCSFPQVRGPQVWVPAVQPINGRHLRSFSWTLDNGEQCLVASLGIHYVCREHTCQPAPPMSWKRSNDLSCWTYLESNRSSVPRVFGKMLSWLSSFVCGAQPFTWLILPHGCHQAPCPCKNGVLRSSLPCVLPATPA